MKKLIALFMLFALLQNIQAQTDKELITETLKQIHRRFDQWKTTVAERSISPRPEFVLCEKRCHQKVVGNGLHHRYERR